MLDKLKLKFWIFTAKIILNVLFRSNKIIIKGQKNVENIINCDLPAMFCCWHGRLLYSSFGLSKIGEGFWAIAGKHRDAEIMGKVLESWGYRLIRGSSNKGSKDVINGINEVFNSKYPFICITNDGPKGPSNVAKPGSIILAEKHNASMVMITGTSSAYWEFKSWDKFRLPKPFGKILITISSPILIPEDIKADKRSSYLSDSMNKIQNEADQCISSLK